MKKSYIGRLARERGREKKLKLKMLEYFVAVAKTNSINAAAESLYIAQPSLTKSLQLLEKELGVQLFYRSHAGIRLTSAGEQILPEAKQVLSLYEGWLALGRMHAAQMDVCSHISLAGFLVPEIIVRFHETHPDVSISYYTSANPEEMIENVPRRPVLVFNICQDTKGRRHMNAGGKIIRRSLVQGEYGCLVNRESKLSEKSSVTFRDLVDHYLVLPNFILEGLDINQKESSVIGGFLPGLVNVIPRHGIIEVGMVSDVIDLVRENPRVYALSFSPAHHRYAGVKEGNLVHVPLREEGVRGALCLLYQEKTYQGDAVFRELVKATEESVKHFCRAFSNGK